jgi:AraC-like DNA-binding protein
VKFFSRTAHNRRGTVTAPSPLTDFFAGLAAPFTAEELFDCLPDTVYFVKNRRCEYVVVNRTLADRCGVGDKRKLLGRTCKDVFPAPLGQAYAKQDETVLRSGQPLRDQLELHLYPSGQTGWCLTNKLPLFGADGAVVGLFGMSHDILPASEVSDYAPVAEAIRLARQELGCRLTVGELAEAVGLSAYQLDHRVERLFRLTASQLLVKIRMDEAARRLRETDRSIALIAADCGYADQSAFTRQFKTTTGYTPREYRRTFG